MKGFRALDVEHGHTKGPGAMPGEIAFRFTGIGDEDEVVTMPKTVARKLLSILQAELGSSTEPKPTPGKEQNPRG